MPYMPFLSEYKNLEDYKNAINLYDQAVAMEKQAKLIEEQNRMLQQEKNTTSQSNYQPTTESIFNYPAFKYGNYKKGSEEYKELQSLYEEVELLSAKYNYLQYTVYSNAEFVFLLDLITGGPALIFFYNQLPIIWKTIAILGFIVPVIVGMFTKMKCNQIKTKLIKLQVKVDALVC